MVVLGHVMISKGVKPYATKGEVVQHFPTPWTLTNVHAFLGFTRYYWKFIKGYAKLAQPLFELL
jgi:hypothetical protein